jgi:hypothetical protein
MINNKLTSKQDNFLKEFLSIPNTKVLYDKKQSKNYEKRFSSERIFSDDDLKNIRPDFYEKNINNLKYLYKLFYMSKKIVLA